LPPLSLSPSIVVRAHTFMPKATLGKVCKCHLHTSNYTAATPAPYLHAGISRGVYFLGLQVKMMKRSCLQQPGAYWSPIRCHFADEPKLAPGTPLFRQLQERGWSDNSPCALFDRLFDSRFKLSVDSLGVDPARIRLICAWIMAYLHYRECASEQASEALTRARNSTNSFGWQPPLVSPIINLQGFAWRLFSGNITTPEAELADESRLKDHWKVLESRSDSHDTHYRQPQQVRRKCYLRCQHYLWLVDLMLILGAHIHAKSISRSPSSGRMF